jgi:uncharacterized protein YgbK (DUF1537 family)
MKTVVLDDDPTGTQSASDVTVLHDSSADLIAGVLLVENSVYVQTNSRALDEEQAVALVSRIRADALEAARRLGTEVSFVLRGDSTLRGHVFAESAVFASETSLIVFVPAFPDGGRTTRGGTHYVEVDGVDRPAGDTEFASDPVFSYRSSELAGFVREKSDLRPVPVALDVVRRGGLAAAISSAAPGSVVIPDAVTNDDIRTIAAGVNEARTGGTSIVVRSAAPLAAALAGVESTGLLPAPLLGRPGPALLVCGSHTAGASSQLAAVTARWGDAAVIDTTAALADPLAAAGPAVAVVRRDLERRGLAVVSSERSRRGEHNTVQHGERVMDALVHVVQAVLPEVDVVITKGGITSADVAARGLGATSSRVLGQVLPGVSVWRPNTPDARERLLVIVPGNVGGPETLLQVLKLTGIDDERTPMLNNELTNETRSTRSLSDSRMMHGGWRDAAGLDEAERLHFDALVDTLIPPDDGWPDAAALGICDLALRYIVPDDEPLSFYPHLRAARLRHLLVAELPDLRELAPEERTVALAGFADAAPEVFALLRDFIYFVYYGHPAVVDLIRTRTRYGRDFHGAPQPLGYREVIETWEDTPLTRKGAFFRTDDVVRMVRSRKDTQNAR